MAAKCSAIDLENAINRYIAGETHDAIWRTSPGVSPERLTKEIIDRGLKRDPKIDHSRSGNTRAQNLRRSLGIDDGDVIRRYVGGESEKALAASFGCSRGVIRTLLNESGINPRNRSEGMYMRMAQSTPEQIAALTQAAHDAARGRSPSMEERCKIARSKQVNIYHQSPSERVLLAMLAERGIFDGIPQLAIGPYNVDIGADPVAVEVFGGGWHGFGHHAVSLPKRVNYLFDAGWNVIVVAVTANQVELTERAADEVVAFIEQSRRDPTFRRQYRVIRGSGNATSLFRLDLDKAA